MKKTIVALLLLVLVLAGARAIIWNSYHEFLSMPLALPEPGYVFQLEPGMNGKAIVRRLEREGFTEDDWRWKLLMRIEPRIYRAGEYLLESGFRPRDVLVKLSGTDVVRYRFTLVEGWTFGQLAGALGQDPVLEDDGDHGEAELGEGPHLGGPRGSHEGGLDGVGDPLLDLDRGETGGLGDHHHLVVGQVGEGLHREIPPGGDRESQPNAEGNTDNTPDHGQQQGLGEKLSADIALPGTDRHP